MTVVKAGASPACPAVTTRASGRARASLAGWTLVLRPPRERPMAWSAGSPRPPSPFAGADGVLVGPAHGRVHRRGPADVVGGVGRGQDGGEDPLPGAVDRPSQQPLVGGLERAQFLRQVPPGRARAVLPRDRLERAPVVGSPPPTDRIGRHQRLDPVPHRITDHQPDRHIRSTAQPIKETRLKPRRAARHGMPVVLDPNDEPAQRYPRAGSSEQWLG